jgi:hypothetical protein
MHIFCSRNLAKIGPKKGFLNFSGTLLELLKKKKASQTAWLSDL